MPELDYAPCPYELEYLWEYFLKLSPKRNNGMGIGPIASTEIESWMRMRGIRPTEFELDVIDSIDQVFMAYHNKKQEKKK